MIRGRRPTMLSPVQTLSITYRSAWADLASSRLLLPTTEPGTRQISFTASDMIPTVSGAVDYWVNPLPAFMVYGTFVAGERLYWRWYRNGSAVADAQSQSLYGGTNYYNLSGQVLSNLVEYTWNPSDTIEVALWTNAVGSVYLDAWQITGLVQGIRLAFHSYGIEIVSMASPILSNPGIASPVTAATYYIYTRLDLFGMSGSYAGPYIPLQGNISQFTYPDGPAALIGVDGKTVVNSSAQALSTGSATTRWYFAGYLLSEMKYRLRRL